MRNRALRSARKSPYKNPTLVYQCLARLAREYVDARREGGEVAELFQDLGVRLERTGEPSRLAQWYNEYHFDLRGKNEFLEWHLKKGVDHSEENSLRIYFYYDDEDQHVIVGHLTSHLTNDMT